MATPCCSLDCQNAPHSLSNVLGLQAGGGQEKKFPREVKFFSTATSSPPNPVYKNFYLRGTFSTLTPHGPHWAHRPPPVEPPPPPPRRPPPPLAPPNPTPPPLLHRLHRDFVEAAPGTMARRGQSHAPDPGADSRSAGFQAQRHQLSNGLFTCICTGAH